MTSDDQATSSFPADGPRDPAPSGPPSTLDEPLELDPGDWEGRAVYHLLTGLVIPRPVGWVSSVSPDGVRNVAPHSYFNLVSGNPPYAFFGSIGVKDSLRNVRESGEFVFNIVSSDLAELMVATAADLPPDVDEFDFFGIPSERAVAVDAPRVAGAPAHLECRVTHEIELEERAHVVIARIVHVHVEPRVWVDGRIDPRLLDPIVRLGGSGFARLADHHRIPRRPWEEIRDLPGPQRIAGREPW